MSDFLVCKGSVMWSLLSPGWRAWISSKSHCGKEEAENKQATTKWSSIRNRNAAQRRHKQTIGLATRGLNQFQEHPTTWKRKNHETPVAGSILSLHDPGYFALKRFCGGKKAGVLRESLSNQRSTEFSALLRKQTDSGEKHEHYTTLTGTWT